MKLNYQFLQIIFILPDKKYDLQTEYGSVSIVYHIITFPLTFFSINLQIPFVNKRTSQGSTSMSYNRLLWNYSEYIPPKDLNQRLYKMFSFH